MVGFITFLLLFYRVVGDGFSIVLASFTGSDQ